MAFTLIQSGSALKMLNASGTASTLTLPSGITLATDRPPRFAQFGRYVVVANTPNRPITVDPLGKVRVLCPYPPSNALALALGAAGNLTGTYKAKQTYVIRDTVGNVIAESDFGPLMTTGLAATADKISGTGINVSADDVTGFNIYRTLAGGEVYFKWLDLEGNTQTTFVEDDLQDLALEVFAAPTLGTPPDLSIVAEWRGRLFGASKVETDVLRWTEPGTMYAWSSLNALSVPRIGADTRGLVGLISRRESLICGRRNTLQQVTGTSNDDFRIVKVSDNVGFESNESIAVYKDVAFFLWKDGVYTLSSDGVDCISDGKVRTWFTKDDTFNRAQFQYAQGLIDPIRLRYRLFLSAAGSTDLDRFIDYDLNDGTWWGPHKTGAFTPKSVFTVYDSNDNAIPMVGDNAGFVWQEQTTATDNTATAIDFNVTTVINTSGSPDRVKYHGRLAVVGKIQTAGTVAVTPYVGTLSAAAGNAMQYVMSKGKHWLGRIGIGQGFKLNFRHTVAGEPVEIYGYDVDEIHPTSGGGER